MRLLLVLPFLLSPLAIAGEHEHAHAHASLDRHEHGVAALDVALEGATLELELRTPAANLLGFEHSPRSAEERQRLGRLQEQLGRPQALFALPASADCRLTEQQLDSPLFAATEHAHVTAAATATSGPTTASPAARPRPSTTSTRPRCSAHSPPPPACRSS